MSHSSFIPNPTPAPHQAVQFVWLRLQGAAGRADERRCFKGCQRATLERGLGIVDVERYGRNRTDRPAAGTPAAHLDDLWLRLVCVLTRLAQQVAANGARLAGHGAFTTPVLPLTPAASGSVHDAR